MNICNKALESFEFMFGFCFEIAFVFGVGFFVFFLQVYHLNNHHLLLILNLFPTRNQSLIWWLLSLISNLALSSLTSDTLK